MRGNGIDPCCPLDQARLQLHFGYLLSKIGPKLIKLHGFPQKIIFVGDLDGSSTCPYDQALGANDPAVLEN